MMELLQTITDVLSAETVETLTATLALAAVVALLIHFCGKLMKASAPFHVSPASCLVDFRKEYLPCHKIPRIFDFHVSLVDC
jgi:hypothetical protein